MKVAHALSLSVLKLSICVAIFFASGNYSAAQDSGGVEDYSKTNEKAAGPGKALGEAAPMLNGSDVDTGMELPNIEASEFKSEVPKLQPIKGFRNLAGSDDVKNLYKDLITKPVPVMFQTMMMVENGAATGFMGSMNAVSNLFSNTVESQRFQLDLFDARVSENPHKQGYVASVVEAVKDKNRDNWPAALWYASGDKVTDNNNQQPPGYQPNDNESGSSPVDAAKQALPTGSGNQNEPVLSEILFGGSAGNQNQQVQLDKLKREFTEWVGDVKDKAPQGGEPSVQSSAPEFVAPTEEVDIRRAGVSRKLTGYDAYVAKQRKEVWESLNEYLKKFCQIKTSSAYTGNVFTGRAFPHQKAQQDSGEAWQKLRSEDIQITENFVDQFFKLLLDDVEDYDELKNNCNQIFTSSSKLPDEGSISEAYNVKDYNDCEGDKPCIPKFIMFSVTKSIAESKAIHHYFRLSGVALQRALAADKSQLWLDRANTLVCQSLGMQDNCFALDTLEEHRQQNRDAFNDFLRRFGMFAQGQGGASVFRPVTNNVPNVQ